MSNQWGRFFLQSISSLLLVSSLTTVVQAQSATKLIPENAAEQKTALYFERIRQSPPQMLAFLRQMPKGGDLHNHLSGAIYAESYIQWASDRGLCVSQVTWIASEAPCEETAAQIPISKALTDQTLYNRLVNAWSMRFWQYSGQNGPDRFFETFSQFGAATDHQTGRMLAEAASQAAKSKVSYLELMLTPASKISRQVGEKAGWDGNFENSFNQLKKNNIDEAVTVGIQEIAAAEKEKNRLLQCETPQADPGCAVTIRYISQISRGAALERVFAQMVTGLMLANLPHSPFVAVNLVQPEDSLMARQNFSLQMQMLNYLHFQYPQAHITLHAGELFPGLVPPDDLTFHIRESVRTGHAERIGHGVAIMNEDQPYELLKELVRRNVLIEICLSSNETILGITGKRHPLATYLEYGVPVALATDDQGIARSDMSQEFLKAAEDQGLGYLQLKMMARNSLEYAFVSGESLWRDRRKFIPIAVCEKGTTKPSQPCQQFLNQSEKARLQWQLEKAFQGFEAEYSVQP
jgi:adenosine deaminase